MTAHQERLFELLALRATEGIGTAEAAEVAQLLPRYPSIEESAFDRAAAAVHLALLGPERKLPGHLRARILDDWHQAHPEAPSSPRAPEFGRSFGWWAAAATLILALAGWWPRLAQQQQFESVATAPASPAELRQTLLRSAESLELAWARTDDAAAAAASGDVVWSNREQTGFMRIAGLEANDPVVSQYQLWIFDRQRDERYPVDGGVFDMTAGGEALIEIDAKVRVGEPYLFAVTVEPPGGVVVSGRERIVLLAQG